MCLFLFLFVNILVCVSTVEDVDNVMIDLSTIGAETTRVLTIADVLNTREQQVANGPSTSFEEWESLPGSVRPES